MSSLTKEPLLGWSNSGRVVSDGKSCRPTGEGPMVLIDAFMHATVVLAIIATFYFVYVSHLSENVYRKQIKTAVQTLMANVLKNMSDDSLRDLNVSKLANYYASTPTRAHDIQNYWLKTVTIIFIVVLVVSLLLIVLLLKYGCGACVRQPLKELLIQNAVIFMFVGVVEAGFFLLVARYYVPVKPSLLMRSALQDTKDVLEGKNVSPAVIG